MKRPHCLLFDCDGVLVDVSASYREVIKETVQVYLRDCLKIPDCDRPLVTDRDIESFKHAGGYNNDWELTYGLLEMFLEEIPPVNIVPLKLKNNLHIINFLGFVGPRLKITGNKLLARKNIAGFLKKRAAKKKSSAAAALLFNRGDVYDTNLVKRLFQEYYLGADNFASIYHRRALLYSGEGYINREVPFINKTALGSLAAKFTLGVVTGRPRTELELTLKRFDISEYFSILVAHEDIEEKEKNYHRETGKEISLGKPHPFGLLTAVERLGLKEDQPAAYIGDLPDDIRAANAAKACHPFISVGVLQAASDNDEASREFTGLKADHILENITELEELFK